VQFPTGRSFLPRDGLNSTLLALGPAFVRQPHVACPSSSLSLDCDQLLTRFLSFHSLLHQQLTLSHSLLAPPTLARNMKIKKLAVTMAIVPLGAATALIAAGTAPYSYGNGSSIYGTGTAAVNPYVSRLSLSLLHLCPALASLPFFPTLDQRLATKEPMSARLILTRELKRWSTSGHYITNYAAFRRIARIRCHQATTKCHTHWNILDPTEPSPHLPPQHLQTGSARRERRPTANGHPMLKAVVSLNQARF